MTSTCKLGLDLRLICDGLELLLSNLLEDDGTAINHRMSPPTTEEDSKSSKYSCFSVVLWRQFGFMHRSGHAQQHDHLRVASASPPSLHRGPSLDFGGIAPLVEIPSCSRWNPSRMPQSVKGPLRPSSVNNFKAEATSPGFTQPRKKGQIVMTHSTSGTTYRTVTFSIEGLVQIFRQP